MVVTSCFSPTVPPVSKIWRANTDGGDLKQLTQGGGNSLPTPSPDGRWIIYASARHGTSTLWRTSIDGEQTQQLTETPSSWPQVSPRGTHIAYTSPVEAPDVRLTIMPFAGGPPLQSFAVPLTGLTGRRVMRWSPDGRAIFYKDDLQGLWRQALAEDWPRRVPGVRRVAGSSPRLVVRREEPRVCDGSDNPGNHPG